MACGSIGGGGVMTMRIYKKLGPEDLQILVNTSDYADALELWQIDEESAQEFLSNPVNCFFACIEDSKIIGYVCGYELSRLDDAGNMLYIHGVGVHRDYRRQGIAKQMIAAVKEFCKVGGIKKMFLYTHKINVAACALYESSEGVQHRDDNVSYFFSKFE